MTKSPKEVVDDIEAIEIQTRINTLATGIIDDLETRVHFQRNDKWEIIAALALAICSFAKASKIPVGKVSEAMAIAARQVRETKP